MSLGVKPGSARPKAIQVMREIGIDISGHRSKSVDEFSGQEFDYVITVCDNARESCPVFPGRTKQVHLQPKTIRSEHTGDKKREAQSFPR
jgi:arsenate reductase (thioredoxin)